MEAFVKVGKELGLSGEELVDFVRGESDKADQRERERKAEEKAADKELRDRVEAEKKAIRESEERERIARDKMERDERNAEREIKRLELENARRESELAVEMERLRSKVDVGASKPVATAKLPKLPHFVENKDNIDAYLKRFERFAETAKWSKDQWATNLSALLQGKSLDVYSRLSATDAVDYDKLKDALLKRFQLTEEGFRVKFRNSKMEVGETAQQFVVRLEEYVLRWMGLAKVEETFEGLKDLILREQFMSSSNKSLQVFLRERKVDSVSEMAEIADQYIEAHGSIANPGNPVDKDTDERVVVEDNDTYVQKPHTSPVKSGRGRTCYICRSGAHLANRCPQNITNTSKAGALTSDEHSFDTRANDQSYNNRGQSFHRRNFGSRSNYRNGYRGGQRGSQNGQQYSYGSENQHCGNNGDFCGSLLEDVVLPSGSLRSSVGNDSPLLLGSCTDQLSRSRNISVVDGYLSGQKVKVLRDSGCSSVVVKRSLVREECLTGETQKCLLIDGTVRHFPIATISVDTPYYTGTVRALCTENPMCDLIIGNITGATDNSDGTWKRNGGSPEASRVEGKQGELGVVQTKSQTMRGEGVPDTEGVRQVGVGSEKMKAWNDDDGKRIDGTDRGRLGEGSDRQSGRARTARAEHSGEGRDAEQTERREQVVGETSDRRGRQSVMSFKDTPVRLKP